MIVRLKYPITRFINKNEFILCLVICLTYPLIFVFFGLDFTDGPWSIRMSSSPDETMELFWLTQKILQYWAKMFGDSILSIRLLNYFINELIILLVLLLFFYNRTRIRFSRYAIVYIVLYTATTSNNFSYDRISLLCLVTALFGIYKFVQSGNHKYLILLGVVNIISFLARFPDIVLVPLIFVLLILYTFFRNHYSAMSLRQKLLKILKLWLIYGSTLGITFFLIYVIALPDNYFIKVYENIFTLSVDNEYHSANNLVNNYIRDIIRMIGYLLAIVTLWIMTLAAGNYTIIKRRIVLLVAAILYFMFLFMTNKGIYNFGYSINIGAIAVFMIISLGYHSYKQRRYMHLFMLVVVFSLLFVTPAGSSTGLLKIKPFATIAIIILMFWVSSANIIGRSQRGFIFTLIVAALFYGLYNRVSWFYGDSKSILELKHTIEHSKLSFIRTTFDRKIYVEKIIDIYNELSAKDNDVVFFGDGGQMFYYLFNKEPLTNQFFYLKPDNNQVIDQLNNSIIDNENNPVVFILFGYANSPKWPGNIVNNPKAHNKEIERSRKLENMLQKNNYHLYRDELYFTVYVR